MKLLGWVIGGLGVAYVLDKMGYINFSGMNTTVTPTVATSPQAANPNAAQQNDTLNAVIAALKAANVDPNSYQTGYTWGWYYTQVRGINGGDPNVLWPNADPNKKYSLNEWWSAMTANGFSGIGTIAHYVNPYLLGPRVVAQFGANLAPTGMETYVKRLN